MLNRLLLILLRPQTAHAALLPDPGGQAPTQVSGSVQTILSGLQANLLRDVYLLLGAIAVIMLIVAGIQYIQSAGDPGKAKTSRAAIVNIVAGIIVIAASYLVIEVITNVAHFFSGKL
jgi:hypothetical protein